MKICRSVDYLKVINSNSMQQTKDNSSWYQELKMKVIKRVCAAMKENTFNWKICFYSDNENAKGGITLRLWKRDVTAQSQLKCSNNIEVSSWVFSFSDHHDTEKTSPMIVSSKTTMLHLLTTFNPTMSSDASMKAVLFCIMRSKQRFFEVIVPLFFPRTPPLP